MKKKSKVTRIANERVYYRDEHGQEQDTSLFTIMDETRLLQSLSLEDRAFVAEESVNNGFYAARSRTGAKLLVSLRRERYLNFFVALMVGAQFMTTFNGMRYAQVFDVTLFGNVLFFPLVFACTDVINELYGYERVQRVIYGLAGCMFLMALLMFITLQFPTKITGWQGSAYFYTVNYRVPYLLLTNALALLIADSLNAYLFAKIKHRMRRKALWLRSVTSTFISQIIFSPINMLMLTILGVTSSSFQEILAVLLSSHGIKMLCAVMMLPFIYAAVRFVERRDDMDIVPEPTKEVF